MGTRFPRVSLTATRSAIPSGYRFLRSLTRRNPANPDMLFQTTRKIL
jgi:hypothetical protein